MIKRIFNYRLWVGNISVFEQLQFDAFIEDCIIKSAREKMRELCLIQQVCPKPLV